MWTVIVGIALLLVSATNFFNPTIIADDKVIEAFQDSPQKPSSKYMDFNGRKIHYVEVGEAQKPLILFIHGSPGSWSDFMGLLSSPELNQQYHMIAIDRFGQGKTGGDYEADLEVQSKVFGQFLKKNQSSEKAILVGHSYGGAVVLQMTVDYQDKLKGTVFAAPILSGELQDEWWVRDVGNAKVVRFMLADWLDNCNQEMMAVPDELNKLQPSLKDIRIPLCMIHGEADVLVPVGNIDYLVSECYNTEVVVHTDEEMNHFIPWSHPHLILESIEYLSSQ